MDRRPLADRRRERTDVVEEAIISQRAAERRQPRGPIGLVRNFEILALRLSWTSIPLQASLAIWSEPGY
ncbi:MAG: hypothetical protein WB048_07055 [Pseudolabrys sp.]